MESIVTWHPPSSLDAVKGWFYPKDQAVMTWLLDRQDRLKPPGDLLELGCYMGKSAVVIGTHLRAGETFTVCDLFDSATEEGADENNNHENRFSYASLTRQAFEGNYLAFHDELPTIVQATTDQITKHVKPGSCRFVHIDASHLWQHVKGDIEAAQTLLRPDGLVVCDDYRAAHTPGVAAAVWTAVANGGLKPICITSNKFYGTWGDPGPVQEELSDWLKDFRPSLPEWQEILGHPIVRVCRWDDPPLPTVLPLRPVAEPDAPAAGPDTAGVPDTSAAQPAVTQPAVTRPGVTQPAVTKPAVARADTPVTQAAVPTRTRRPRWSARARSIARDLLPPVITRALKRARSH